MAHRKLRLALALSLFALGCARAEAQQIPGAPSGVVSLQWSLPDGGNVSQYADAGFAYPAPSGGIYGVGPQGSYYALLDGGSGVLIGGPISPGPQGRVEIVLSTAGGGTPAGTVQAQESNDGLTWANLGSTVTLDGGVGPFTFGDVGSQVQISPSARALVRLYVSNTTTGNATIAATSSSR